jgi:hypothetical protein
MNNKTDEALVELGTCHRKEPQPDDELFNELWEKHHYLKALDRVGYIKVFNDFRTALSRSHAAGHAAGQREVLQIVDSVVGEDEMVPTIADDSVWPIHVEAINTERARIRKLLAPLSNPQSHE